MEGHMDFSCGDTACFGTILKRCQSSPLLGHHPLLALAKGLSSYRARVSLLLGWQHTWDSLAVAASARVCGWPWLISQPVCRSAPEAVISAPSAQPALSNVGEPIKEQSLGDTPHPRDPRLSWAGWGCALSCPMSWPVYHCMTPFLAELAISSLIRHLWFSSPGKGDSGHPLLGVGVWEGISLLPSQRDLWDSLLSPFKDERETLHLIPGVVSNKPLYNSA